ncbi:MAG: protein kinase [Acidobacteria bacterium]|nr:protein kinase [Acidobacteriota bacterium]
MTSVTPDSGRLTEESKTAFVQALKLPPDERAAFLEKAIARPEDRAEVARLLEWYRDDFLDDSVAPPSTLNSLFTEISGDGSGRRFGDYVTERELGRGGMGVVYLARRADDLHDRLVAIKCLQAGADRAELLSRLRREMRILASLHHPYIVSFVDAGLSHNAIYLVMEYVEGRPLDVYCREEKLSPRRRLSLFMRICSAVAHAHRSLVVHRDLKPANILVTGDGSPKLLDFGVAKVLNESGCESLTTAAGWRATVRYASPEQIQPDAALSTASDVYSLGVILYELLTGQSPYGPKTDPAPLLDAVLNRDPIDPRSIVPKLDRDLQHILMKALRKNPEDRYSTVDELRADVANYLDDKPVAAREGAFWYVMAKFVRRRWAGVTAAMLVVMAIAAGSLLSWSYARESDARLMQLIATTDRLLTLVRHERVHDHEAMTQAIVQTGQDLHAVATSFHGSDRMLGELANSLLMLADEEAHPSVQNVGATDSALRILEQAWSMAALLHERHPRDIATTERYVSASFSLGTVLIEENRYAEAQPYFERIAEWAPRENRLNDYAEALANLSRLALHDNDEKRCLELRRRAVEIRQKLAGKGNEAVDIAYAGTLATLGFGLRSFGHQAEALDAYRRSERALDALPESRGSSVIKSMRAKNREQVSRILLATGRNTEALEAAKESVAIFRNIEEQTSWSAGNRRSTAVALGVLAHALDSMGKRAEARLAVREAVKLIDAAAAADPANRKVREEAAEIYARAAAVTAR